MLRKIKNSLNAKVFLWVFSSLTICSMLIYGIVLTVLPKQYLIASENQLYTNTQILAAKLQVMRYNDAVKEIYNFCIKNNSAAALTDNKETLYFGEIKTEELNTTISSVAVTVVFTDDEREYMLVISSLSKTADIISGLMIRFLPVVFVIILFLSSLSALICSKVIVSPIAEISRISERMTSFDMTWKCDIKSNDEIGVLAVSLNTMAERLRKTMEELKNANYRLTEDVEKFKTLEEQRRNFFAAVSHELKTPLTILKGQIENMILGCGDYRNHDKYLPEALKASENIECLVNEIIAISKMESMDLRDTLRELSLKQSVSDTVCAVLPLARDKDIRIHQNIGADMVLTVNPNLWNKALSNIIGNAVRHSPKGEEVFISVESSESLNALVVENTGAFIPEDDIPHLFTPFYRADKSRSKATGGSGLGLYIVKTILDLHGMNYCIKNTERGTAFFLFLNF